MTVDTSVWNIDPHAPDPYATAHLKLQGTRCPNIHNVPTVGVPLWAWPQRADFPRDEQPMQACPPCAHPAPAESAEETAVDADVWNIDPHDGSTYVPPASDQLPDRVHCPAGGTPTWARPARCPRPA